MAEGLVGASSGFNCNLTSLFRASGPHGMFVVVLMLQIRVRMSVVFMSSPFLVFHVGFIAIVKPQVARLVLV